MDQKKIFLLGLIAIGLIGGGYLLIQIKQALDEYYHWKSREAVLEKELEELRIEVTKHRKFLDKLRTDPSYQEEIARKRIRIRKRRRKTLQISRKKS